MTPEEYEKYVASLYQARGYKTIVTPLSGDWGIDVIATKGTEKNSNSSQDVWSYS